MKIIKNSIYNIMYQIITVLLPIITVPYISRVLGEGGVGKQAYTLAFAQYFILIGSIGLNLYGNRQIAYVRDDKKKLNETFWQLVYLRIITMSISIAIYYIVFVGINNHDRFIYAIQGINILAALLDISWYFMGLEEFKATVTRNVFVKIVGVICIFIFVKDISDVSTYIVILSLSQLLGQLVMWIKIPKFISIKESDNTELKKHFKFAIKLFIPQLAAQVYLLLDRIMLGMMVGESAVGLYENSQKIIRLAMPIVTSVGVVLLPRMANLYSNGKMDEFKEYIYKAFSSMNFISIPLAFGIIGITKNFKPWFFGPGFNGIELLIIVSSFIIIFGTWCNIIGFQVLVPMNKEREFTISVTVAAIVNFTINLFLIRKIGALGTTISSVIAEFLVPCIQIYYIKGFIDVKLLFKGINKILMASTFMLIVVICTSVFLPASILSTLIEVIIGIVVYFGIMYIMKNDILIYAIDIVGDFLKSYNKR